MITPILAIIVDDLDDELVNFEPNCINPIISETEDDLEDSFVEEGLIGYEGFQYVDDLTFYAPIISQELLQERLYDLLVQNLFVHSG